MNVALGRLLSALVVLLGLTALLGWVVEEDALTTLFLGAATIKVNTALCFIALGLAGWLRGTDRQRTRTVLESAAWIVAIATTYEHLSGRSLGIDELILDDPITQDGTPGRPSLGAALALAFTATGMLGLDSLRRRVRVGAIVPLLIGGGIGFIGLVGHAALLDEYYWATDATSMAIATAFAIVLLVASTLVLAPDEGLKAVVMRPTVGGRLLRRLVPAALVVPSAFVVPIGWGISRGYFSIGVPMLLLLIGTVLAAMPPVFWTARTLDLADARARADAARFESVLRAATDTAIIGTDTSRMITIFNEGAERLLGYRADEMIGRETPRRIHEPAEIAARAREYGLDDGPELFLEAARRGEREWTYVHKDGRRIPVSLTVTPMQATDGTHSGHIGLAFDLTRRRELERELRRQADFTGTLVGSAPVGIFATDTAGGCIFTNTKCQELIGLTAAEVLGDGWIRAVHSQDVAYVTSAWTSFAKGGPVFAATYRFVRPDGSVVWVDAQAVALRGEHGELTGYLGTILDVTQRHEAETQREQLLSESRAVLDSSIDGVLMTDLEGEVLFTNAAMGAFWQDVGLAGEGTIWERIARLARKITEPEEYHRLLEAVALDPEREHVGEMTIADSGRSFIGRTAPVRGADGLLMGRIFSMRETTTERAAARAKDEFVATVSHELRTPLAAIAGYAELLEDDVAALGEESTQFLGVVQRNATRLARLVDDLLLVQQSETDGVTVKLADIELAEVLRASVERVEPAADRKSISVDVEGNESLVVRADPMRFGQILDNLLSNAVKFTPESGVIELRVRRDGNLCSIEVEDSGPGIPEDERGRVFERFFRSRDAVSRAIPGTGLGLVVSRRIAEAHGGALDLVSGSGTGATFRLLLPLADPVVQRDRAVSRGGAETPIARTGDRER